jgi:peptide/bleomycin uptake transporter
MFASFFKSREWLLWAWLGAVVIVAGTWYQVQVDVAINEWFGTFYDIVQKALSKPNAVSEAEFYGSLLSFFKIASIYIVVATVLSFFTKHWVFRWRTAMNDYYTRNWTKLHHIEGASQRVQEDTKRFASIMEGLGTSLLDSILTLIAFLPILHELSKKVTALPLIGPVDHSLIYVAVLFALFGTVLLALVGYKLPGLEFKNQVVEAAYRKQLVYGEDHADRITPPTVAEFFGNVRKNYFRLFFHYLYFDVARYSYLQVGVLVPYAALAPTIVAGAVTLGVMQQIVRAFSRVESSLQYLVRSWSVIVELISIYKRLQAFEASMKGAPLPEWERPSAP